MNVAERIRGAGEKGLAAELYRVWIVHNQANPLVYAANFNYGIFLTAVDDLKGARDAYLEVIKANPEFFSAYINLGTVYERLGAADQAALQWLEVVNRLPAVVGENIAHKATALKQLGRVLEQVNDVSAENALARCLEINKDQGDVIQHLINIWQRQCRWPCVAPFSNVTRAELLRHISPLSVAAYSDDPMFQLAVANQYVNCDLGRSPVLQTIGDWVPPERRERRRLRIGYVSSDYRQHAIGFLMAGMFEHHDRDKVEVTVYYCGPAMPDDIQARIKSTVDRWIDIDPMSDKEAARQILGDGIDILIDVNGHTKFARTRVFGMKPAPIIVNWLGFPGSMGTPYHHYIIADDYIIPEENEIYYTERVKRLPCYQMNDRKRLVSPDRPSRGDMGLPEDAVVYSCFNGSQKITRFAFLRWMEILSKVPNGVLWVLKGIPAANEQLKRVAQEHGIAPERIVFADTLRNPDHLARYPLADLFLDTSPYGAHTTASDALWMGVPVVTLPGRSFASRVCGSLARAAGLEEMICPTPEAYVALAVELGLDPRKRQFYRDKLAAERDTCVLFDTAAAVRSLEKLYEEMWEDYCAGNLPVPRLTNLEIYHDIAIAHDHEGVEVLTVARYRERYEAQMAFRYAMSPIPFDSRFWTEEVAARFSGG